MNARVLWPQRQSLYDLMKHRAVIGSAAFEHEHQGNPVDPEAQEWGPDYFDYPGFWFDQWPDGMLRVMGCDPSKGKDAKAGDYSAYVLYGLAPNGTEYVEADLKRRPPEQIVADGVEHYRLFRPEGMALETNTFQELFQADFMRVAREQKVDLRVYPFENMVNKLVRIRRNGPYLYQRRARFKARSPGTMLLIEQLRDFPTGEHDDGPDALELARRLAIQLWNGKQGNRPKRLEV